MLYVQDDPFSVIPTALPTVHSADYARQQGRLDFWKGYLERLDPVTTDPAVLAEVIGIIAQIQASLPQGSG